jgi:tetratricopeptide (TPR) repeat protein
MIRYVAFLSCALLLGCQSTQREAREQAEQRWDRARAEVKAKLAADQFAAGDVRGAAAQLAEACRLAPDAPDFIPLRVRVLLAEGQLTAAEELLRNNSTAPEPAQAELAYLRGVVCQQQQRWDEACATFEQASELAPHDVSYLVAATQARLQLGQPQAALECLIAGAERHGWTETYQATLAECCEQLGDWPAAAAAWRRVAGAPGVDAESRARLGLALFQAGRFADAIPELLHAAGAAPTDEVAALRLALAECYLHVGQPTLARTQVQLAARAAPDDVRVFTLLAQAHATCGDFDLARQAGARALSVSPDNPRALELAAALAWQAGDRLAAAATAERLSVREPENPIARHILAAAGEPRPRRP